MKLLFPLFIGLSTLFHPPGLFASEGGRLSASDRGPQRYPDSEPMAMVLVGQAFVGLLGGVTGAMVGAAAGFMADDCHLAMQQEAGSGAEVDGNCTYPFLAIGMITGYAAGTAGGIALVGHGAEKRGSFLATMAGAGLGAAGVLYLGMRGRGEATHWMTLAAVGGNLSALTLYHVTDRFRIRTALAPPGNRDGDQAGRAGPATGLPLALTLEAQADLYRF